ncbi:MAG: WG repeat-containing protein, partial [Saprospiraceae bacterium]|nr:WG repeat-containing protein [Saprospiraceae bacterium]
GLMSPEGLLILQPIYEAIGNFDRHGYSVIKEDGKVGILDHQGSIIVSTSFDDIKVLDEKVFAASQDGQWRIINNTGKVILDKNYEKVEVRRGEFLAYRSGGLWGMVRLSGEDFIACKYNLLEEFGDGYLRTNKEGQQGLIDPAGEEILVPVAETIYRLDKDFFIFQLNGKLGLISGAEGEILKPEFNSMRPIGPEHLMLTSETSRSLYDLSCQSMIYRGGAEDFQSLGGGWILAIENGKTGLINLDGELIIAPEYDEILLWSSKAFRVRDGSKWGLVSNLGESIVHPLYQYIGPIDKKMALVKHQNKLGLINSAGDPVLGCHYEKVDFTKTEARGLSDGVLDVVSLAKTGENAPAAQFKNYFTISIGKDSEEGDQEPSAVDNELVLEDYEWFYSAAEKKWGLRDIEKGTMRIRPSFDWIKVDHGLGITLVANEQTGYQDFEFTRYRFQRHFGIVNNKIGLLVGDLAFLDIKLEDFLEGSKLARVILKGGRHGLIDKTGKIQARDYAFIGKSSDGFNRVSFKGKLSATLKKSNYHIMPLKDYLEGMLSPSLRIDYTLYDQTFDQDAQLFCEDCEWGYLDKTGHLEIPLNYDYAHDFLNGVGLVMKKSKWGAIDKTEKELIPCQYDHIGFLENTQNTMLRVSRNIQKYGLIDTLGQVLVDYQYDDIGPLSEGRLAVKRNGLWGFVNLRGQEIIPCRFRRINPFSEGLASVKLKNGWGIIDKQGEVVLDFKYSKLGNFVKGLAWANDDHRIGFIDTKGNFEIPAKYSKAFDFEKGLARVVVKGKYGLIDQSGRYILRPTFSKIEAFNQYGTAVVQVSGSRVKFGLINLKGELITNRSFLEIGDYSEGYAHVKLKDRVGFIDKHGRLDINPNYFKAGDFREGRAWVQKDGVCGYINQAGEEVIDLEYSKCLDFSRGKAVVFKGYKQGGIIDLDGNFVIEPRINRLYGFQEGRGLVRDKSYKFYYISEDNSLSKRYYDKAGQFKHGIALVQMNGKWGIINQQGASIVPPKYDRIDDFVDGFAKVRIQRFTGLSNLHGEFLLQPNFEYVSDAGNGLFRVERGDKLGYFDQNGKWIWELQD